MTKRSAAITELENQLRDMLSANGGLLETRWVGRFVELMKETANSDGREYLLKVFFNTPQSEKAALARFVQLNGVEILGNWINEHRGSSEQEDNQIVHSCLSCINKLTISTELLDRTHIGKIVNKLVKHPDPSIQAKANTIVSKWKKMVTEQEDPKKLQKPKKETRVIVPKK
jgi:TFIIS helical bundle-like domain.